MNEQTALMPIPRCPVDEIPLTLRTGLSSEARFCGTWYDCPRCHYTVLLPSRELTAQLDEQRRRAKEGL